MTGAASRPGPRAVVLHGHFYQPPRENPWLDYVEAEPSAQPFHDWNRRIERDCYRAVVAARLLDGDGRIARIENTLAWLSFDVGPTLLEWLEREAPATYGAVLEADRVSRERLGGFGNAIAMPFHHVILPLSSRRDKVTEVRWGVADFRRRFGREPLGMWLPETAVDDETLDVLAAEGLRFTVLAPHQVKGAPPHGLPGRYRTSRGRTIALFVYDGPLSHDVAFGPLLQDAERWAERVVAGGARRAAVPSLVALATDGETYGHHHRFGEMALARLLEILRARPGVVIENFASFLARHPPGHDVALVEPSSWSCPHGVDRWRRDCGCRLAPEKGWHQKWRAPLRDGLTWLADELHGIFEREGRALLGDPWAARDAYCATFGPGGEPPDRFLARLAGRPLGSDDVVRGLELLELERNALRLFASCAWYFDDIGGLEPLQVLRYAARAVELAGAEGPRLEGGLLDRLASAASNDPVIGDGSTLYRDRARPAVAVPARVAGSYAAVRRLARRAATDRIYCYDATLEGRDVVVTNRATGRRSAFDFEVERPAGGGVVVSVTPTGGGAAVVLGLADLLERERDAVAAALETELAGRTLGPGVAAAWAAAAADLTGMAEQALVHALERLATDQSPATQERVTDLVELLELAGHGVPFDAQTVFFRVREHLAHDKARALHALAHRLGFADGG